MANQLQTTLTAVPRGRKTSSTVAMSGNVTTRDITETGNHTDLAVVSSNPNLTIQNSYSGTKGTVGTETEVLTYSGNWSAMSMPSSQNWSSITYGNGRFVAVATSSSTGAYSTDGITWTSMTLPSASRWTSVTYGNGKFVCVSNNTEGYTAYSSDGINWTQTTALSALSTYSVTYGGNKFVTVSNLNDYAAYSTDGINWSYVQTGEIDCWHEVAYGDGKFVAMPYANYSRGMYSPDGINWTKTTLPIANTWNSVTYGNGKFVALTIYGSTGVYSADGINWTTMTLPQSFTNPVVCYGDGKFVIISAYSTVGAYSTDGVNWSTMNLLNSSNWKSICYGSDKFVAVATSATGAYLSSTPHWQNSSSQEVQLSDYQLSITSGTPATNDTLSLTYTTTGGQNISSRLPLVSTYVGPESTVGSKQVILTYNDGVWTNNQSQTVTLADYLLSTTGTPVAGDTITLSYNTVGGQDISSRLTVTNNYTGTKEEAGITTSTLTCKDNEPIVYYGYQEPIGETVRYLRGSMEVGATVYSKSDSTFSSAGTIGSIEGSSFYIAGEGIGISGPFGRYAEADESVPVEGTYWQDENNNTITLADYSLVATGTPINGDTIAITYTTLDNQNISSRLAITSSYSGTKEEDGIEREVLTYSPVRTIYGWGDANGWSQPILTENGTAGLSEVALSLNYTPTLTTVTGQPYYLMDGDSSTYLYVDGEALNIDMVFRSAVKLDTITLSKTYISGLGTFASAIVQVKDNESDSWSSVSTNIVANSVTFLEVTFELAEAKKYYRLVLVSADDDEPFRLNQLDLYPLKYFTNSTTLAEGDRVYNELGEDTGLEVSSYSASSGIDVRKRT